MNITNVMTIHLVARDIVAAAANERWGVIAETTKIIAWTTESPWYHEASNAILPAAELLLIATPGNAATRPYATAEHPVLWAHERWHT